MAADAAVLYWQRAASYIQTKTFDILQYVASQSTPKPQPDSTRQHDLNLKGQTVVAHEETKEPSSPVASSSSSSSSGSGEIEKSDAGPTEEPPLPDSDVVLTKEKESKKESVMEEPKESVRVTRARLRKATSLQ